MSRATSQSSNNTASIQVSLVITVLNESKSLPELLAAIDSQTYQPQEIVLVDGGSTDGSLDILKKWQSQKKSKKQIKKIISLPSTISQGRNEGIRQASHSWIALTDAGCIPQNDWLEMLIRKATNQVDIVAGYYAGADTTAFEAAVVPFVLVQPDTLDLHSFLPATRSMLLRKKVWSELGGFREDLLVSEDYVFALAAKHAGYQIATAVEAIVLWQPRSSLKAFIKMVWKHAYYDQIGGVRRKKVDFIFYRYAFGILLIVATQSLLIGFFGVFMYILWSILKHHNHMPHKGWYYLPVLQIASDIAVMAATVSATFTQLNSYS